MRARSLFRETRGIIIVAAAVAALMYLLLALGSAPAPVNPASNQSVASLPPGSEGQLQNGKSFIPVAIDEELLPELSRLANAADSSRALSEMSGRIFLVDPLTSIRVSETGINGTRVRILTGPEKGRLGWVPADWLKPL